ncbi:MAG: hypothetical protein KBT27_02645 [Prevotellaceae bacterium]|nr:hypothetical protein [Candidatus Faecinaster equi]
MSVAEIGKIMESSTFRLWLSKHEDQIRADAIDECIKHFEEHHIVVFDKFEIVDELEQLKEQNK